MISEADSQTNLLTNIQGGIMIDHNFEERQFVKIRYQDAEDIPRERYLSIEEIGDLQAWSKQMIKGYGKKAAVTGARFDKSEFIIKTLLEVKHINPGKIRKVDLSIQNVKRLLEADDAISVICGQDVSSEIEMWENDFINLNGDEYLTLVINEAKRARKQFRKNIEHMFAFTSWMSDRSVITENYPH